MRRCKVHIAPTPLELAAKVYAWHGWRRKAGESRQGRVAELYRVFVDHKKNRYVAIPLNPNKES